MFLITFFIVLQISLLLIVALHDWVHFPPLTDITALQQSHSIGMRLFGSCITSVLVGIPLLLTLFYGASFPYYAVLIMVLCYGLLTIGTITAWWIPYIFGSSPAHKQGFIEYKNTHAFLPPRGDNVIPNTLHCIMHLHIWLCLGIALYLLVI